MVRRIAKLALLGISVLATLIYIICEMALENTQLVHLIITILIVAGSIALLLKLLIDDRNSMRIYYETKYAKEIRNSFENEKRTRNRLLNALHLYHVGESSRSISKLKRLVSHCEKTVEHRVVGLFLALNYTNLELLDKAAEEYEKLVWKGYANSQIHSNLGHIYARLGKNDKAKHHYSQATYIDPSNENAYNNLAQLLFKEYDFENAIKYSKKSLEINSRYRPSTNLLAIIYAVKGDNERADKYFHRAVSNGESPESLKKAINYYKTQF